MISLERRRRPAAVRRSGIRMAAAAWILFTAAACGSDAETAPVPVRPQAPGEEHPLAAIPREELYGASPGESLWSPRYELEVLDLPRGWDGARFAILSDPQLGRYPENREIAESAVRRALESGADAFLLIGDFVGSMDDVPLIGEIFGPLRGRPAVAVLGGRDVRTDSLEAAVASALTGLGVQVVRNGTAPLQRNGAEILVAGLDPDLVSRTWADQQYILATLGEPGRTPILLTHAPTMATRAPMRRYPIVVGGNTFCGTVEVPGTPRLSWLRNEIFPNAAIEGSDRLFRVQGSTVLVACGIGYAFVPTRFWNAPEVPILTIRRVGLPGEVGPGEAVEDTLIQRFQSPRDTL
jgi:uncharacterized protein